MYLSFVIAEIAICRQAFSLLEHYKAELFLVLSSCSGQQFSKLAKSFLWFLLTLVVLNVIPVSAAAPHFNFVLDNIEHPAFSLRAFDIRLESVPSPRLEAHLGELKVGQRQWRDTRLSCDRFSLSRSSINCSAGVLQFSGKSLPISFEFLIQKKQLVLTIFSDHARDPAKKWQITADWQAKSWQVRLDIVRGDGKILAAFFSQDDDWPQIHQARINGVIQVSGKETAVSRMSAELKVDELSFSDTDGLHAGENIHFQFRGNVRRSKQGWRWYAQAIWPEGEVFWQPFYFVGADQKLSIRGTVRDQYLNIARGRLDVPDIGRADFTIDADLAELEIQNASFSAKNTNLSTLFERYLRPLAVETALADAQADGYADLVWHYQNGAHQSLIIDLRNVALADSYEQFSIAGLSAHIPWSNTEVVNGEIRLRAAQVQKIPLGITKIPFKVDRNRISFPHAEIPVLDGSVWIENFMAGWYETGWQWQFNGYVLPISMDKLTTSFDMQPLFGKLSGRIPKVSYANSTMMVEGELLFDIFDGRGSISNLSLTGLFGRIPRLTADIVMRQIDLDLLTRAYSFGSMQGRIDVAVKDLELANWEPVKFDAVLTSSPGDYKRRISQAAVENLTALGGQSAVTAIQNSFLSFFKQFRYAELGWRCKLQNNVCQMSGIRPWTESAQNYVLVKGSGIPAITITGYNRSVDWSELIKRLEHAIESGAPMVH